MVRRTVLIETESTEVRFRNAYGVWRTYQIWALLHYIMNRSSYPMICNGNDVDYIVNDLW